MKRIVLAVALGLIAAACATRGTASSSNAVTRSVSTRRMNVISSEEIMENRALVSVGDLVRQLRPAWRYSAIFLGEQLYDGTLANLQSGNVREVRYLSASEAQMKWGMRYQEVVQVILK